MSVTIISIIITAVISVVIARWQMKKNQIDHYSINFYDIGKGLTDDFPEFSLHYGEKKLSNNVKVLQGGFIDIGRSDIGANGDQTCFKLSLPQCCIVIAIKVFPIGTGLKVKAIKKGEQSNSDIIVNENELGFEIDGIFKSQELFNYTAIVMAPEGLNGIPKLLKFNHRIINTQDIRNIIIGQYYRNPDGKYMRWASWLILSMVIGMSLSLLFTKTEQYIHFFDELLGMGEKQFMIVFPLLLLLIAYVALLLVSINTLFGIKGRIIKVLNKYSI